MPKIDVDRHFWSRTVAHVRGLTDQVLVKFDEQAANFSKRGWSEDIRAQELYVARMKHQ